MARGVFVVVVGPDGVGKSTFASALMERWGPPAHYFHFRPPLARPMPSTVPVDRPLPKNSSPVSQVLGWMHLAVAVSRFWLGYLASVRPALRNGSLVVGDRWAFGYLVQPVSLKFAGPPGLARLALRLLPRPDIVFNLAAPAEVIQSRKAELTAEAIKHELSMWKSLEVKHLVTLDAESDPQGLVDSAMAVLHP